MVWWVYKSAYVTDGFDVRYTDLVHNTDRVHNSDLVANVIIPQLLT